MKNLIFSIVGTAGFNKSFLWDAKLTDALHNIIGNYTTFGQWIEETSMNDLAKHVITEVEEGLEGTRYKAGQVKFGTGYNRIIPLEEKTIRAVARAHHETKAPVHSHTEAGTMALEQADFLVVLIG
jgi:phosphotriesterase-related protein